MLLAGMRVLLRPMKSSRALLFLSFAATHVALEAPMKPVIDMLSKMLSDSEKDGAADDKMFASFRDHCVSTTHETETQIAGLTETDEALDEELERLNAEKDKTEDEIADLRKFLAKNNESQTGANDTRKKDLAQYKEDVAHQWSMVNGLTKAMSQLGGSVTNTSLLALDDSASLGLDGEASAAWEKARQMQKNMGHASSFLQVRVRGFGEVRGTIENLKRQADTDMAELNQTETASLAAYAKLMASLKKAEATLTESVSSKTALKGNLATDIATKEGQQKTTLKTLKDDKTFLEDLTNSCQKKTQIYEERTELRRGEEAAVKMALSILDSDRGDKVFKETDATSFVQMHMVQGSHPADVEVARLLSGPFVPELVAMIQEEAAKSGSTRLSRLAALARVQSQIDGNPFAIVLTEIDKMKARISKESGLDKKQLSWCQNERAVSKSAIDTKDKEMTSLDDAITKLNTSIEGPTSGLLKTIATQEKQLADNALEQKKETDERKDDNKKYIKNIQTIMLAQGMLKKALDTLQDYYAEMKAHRLNSFVQTDEDKPTAWNATSMKDKASSSDPDYKLSAYEGQSKTGNEVITKLTEILQGSQKEEAAAHKGEATAQESFEDTMTLLTKQQNDLFDALAANKKDLATAMLNLKNHQDEKAAAEKQMATIEEYVRQIKPACDFITSSFDTREASRGLEKESLTKAQSLITGSAAYKKLSDIAKRKEY
eukprot:TRINITY_DN89141_c0_g1_i1.p1 TRINITY_DN89141_c0_g1~~TRINITY_DN89141_c0_g1_i1.p1  ORF type:complete len:719 (+),score=202.57 TRINITY_DN89141_c0_g1_i1:18-2174(+)